MDIKQLYELGEGLLSKKQPINSLWQEISDNFYPERADFTLHRSIGTDFAAQLMTSYPVVCRRDLGNAFGTMLRPTAKDWFHSGRKHEEKDPADVKVWLDYFDKTMRRAMYDPGSLFTKATKQGDHDFAAFGQCAISVELNKNRNGMLYRCWHLRDMAWEEDSEGQIGFVVRRTKYKAHQLKQMFGETKLADAIKRTVDTDPFQEVRVMHFVVDAEMYDKNAMGRPRMSIWYDVDHQHLMLDTPLWGRYYVIPRWQTVSGSQYSYSPATVCALPDARLIQAMTFTLLEAGEKATQPPMIATKDAVKSDVALYAGGITWVDADYDEKLGEALRPLTQDLRGFEHGVQMNADTRAMLHNAFFLDRLSMPERAPEMTAYEVGQRVQEYIRNALPIFEPMEMEYNSALCDETFDILMRNGGFGSPANFPPQLRGTEIDFSFESPLHDAIEQQKGTLFTQSQQLVGAAVALDPSSSFLPKTEVALRDALVGIGVPGAWLNTQAYVDEQKKNQADQQRQAQTLASMESASTSAKNLGQAGLLPQQQSGLAQRAA